MLEVYSDQISHWYSTHKDRQTHAIGKGIDLFSVADVFKSF